MAIRFVSSSGNLVTSPAVINMRCSGTVHKDCLVDWSRTGGLGVYPSSSSSTNTMIFGVCQGYKQGKSEAEVPVIMLASGQLFEVDCVAAATTAQIGIRHAMNDDALVRNTGTAVEDGTGVFLALAMTGSTSGSGKLIGVFEQKAGVYPDNTTTFS